MDIRSLTHVRACLEDCDDRGLETPGYPPEQWGDPAALARVAWFDEEMLSGKHVDFFHKRPTAYAKKVRWFSAGELF